MAKGDEHANMTQQSRKKRPDDDDQFAGDGPKPLQLQRRRVWRACESCRRKKIKCDGSEPTCSQCVASGSQCTWLQTKDRAALSRHYVQELEGRLLQMESLFNQLAPVLDQIGISTNGGNLAEIQSAIPSIPAENIAKAASILNSTPAQPRSAEPSPIKVEEDDMSDSFGQLAVDEYGHGRWMGGSSSMSLIQSLRQLTTTPLQHASPMDENSPEPGPNKLFFPGAVFFGKVRALPGPEEVEYPDRELADRLVDAYFSRLHYLLPVIDKPSFMKQYVSLMDNTHDIVKHRTETAFISLVFAVFACGANIVIPDRIDDGGMGMVYYERALILHYISHAKITVEHVQCFTLLSSFLCAVNCLPQAWILTGQAVRMAQDLGLHRSPRRQRNLSEVQKETHRKIFWGVYVMDRMLALSLGRPLGINDSDCDVEQLVPIDDEYLPDYLLHNITTSSRPFLMTGFILLTKLYHLAGRMLREVYSLDYIKDNMDTERQAQLQRTVETLDAALQRWLEEIPEIFKNRSERDEHVCVGTVLLSHYYSVQMTLHRNHLPVKRVQPANPKLSAKSTVQAVSAARSCIRLAPSMKAVVPPSHDLAFFLQHLFSSAVILLLYAMHTPNNTAASAAMEEAKSPLMALQSWEGVWPGARKCRELLSELVHTANQAMTRNALEKTPPPATVAPALAEGRRSVHISTAPGNAVAGRAIKNRSRRNLSRDGPPSNRRLDAVSPYRNSQRARSSSRKRGLDDDDLTANPLSSYYNTFPSPVSPHPSAAASPHSSPASVNLPSPAPGAHMDHGQDVPHMSMTNSFYAPPPMSPSRSGSSQYDFGDYGMQGVGPSQPWGNGNGTSGAGGGGGDGLDLFSQGGQQDAQAFSGGQYGGGYASHAGYDDMNMGSLSASLTAQFAEPGLPFSGLDFLRTYGNSNGSYPPARGSNADLWSSFDGAAFQYNPEMPLAFNDNHPTDG
ncbi:fungal-specific transcription factor domain-containing protein [Schizophyllum amplum]|uniref:Fungal-specific transcription factor domain-containing protein n=1 Tax=Schizophyllum amplum TaxID=97359 RepID=A0A550CU90_9AGAR|nr:fungal-specific transcription factor domain-containing protein [Auriculariopsis ampla]